MEGWPGARPRVHHTKQLTRLYSECGAHLHVITLKTLKRGAFKPMDIYAGMTRLLKALEGIRNLLAFHTIQTKDPALQLWVQLAPPNQEGPNVRLIRIHDGSEQYFRLLETFRGQADRHG